MRERRELKPEYLKCKPDDRQEDQYYLLLGLFHANFKNNTQSNEKLFYVDAKGLFEIYLENMKKEAREHYDCDTCRRFIEQYGGLVKICEDYSLKSVLWDFEGVPEFFKKSFKEMNKFVVSRPIKRLFATSEFTLGIHETGPWNHFSVEMPTHLIYLNQEVTSNQYMAAKKDEFGMLCRAINNFSYETASKAVNLLNDGGLYRADKAILVANWFLGIHKSIKALENVKYRRNVIWKFVITAPEGYCHINTSMIGTILSDIESGMSAISIKSRYEHKMNPRLYGRSLVLPTEAELINAERVIRDLECEDSLKRRHADMEDIQEFVWMPKGPYNVLRKQSTLFGNVETKDKKKKQQFELPEVTMTWVKFKETVLPDSETIAVKVNRNRLMSMVTSEVEDSKNIFQWDNPVTWYYNDGIDSEFKKRVLEAGGQYEDVDIRCSLLWDNYTDLDLHCITPFGQHIWYNGKRSTCGGYLDIDKNATERETMKPVENIRWQKGSAREGLYKFYVKNFRQRGEYVHYKVELEVNGHFYEIDCKPLHEKEEREAFIFDYKKGCGAVLSDTVSKASMNNDFVNVKAIVKSPNLWGDNPKEHIGNHTFFLLDDIRNDTESAKGFFNEMLIPELRDIRRVLESYTDSEPISGEAVLSGVGYNKDNDWNLKIKVKTKDTVKVIKIDRFD